MEVIIDKSELSLFLNMANRLRIKEGGKCDVVLLKAKGDSFELSVYDGNNIVRFSSMKCEVVGDGEALCSVVSFRKSICNLEGVIKFKEAKSLTIRDASSVFRLPMMDVEDVSLLMDIDAQFPENIFYECDISCVAPGACLVGSGSYFTSMNQIELTIGALPTICSIGFSDCVFAGPYTKDGKRIYISKETMSLLELMKACYLGSNVDKENYDGPWLFTNKDKSIKLYSSQLVSKFPDWRDTYEGNFCSFDKNFRIVISREKLLKLIEKSMALKEKANNACRIGFKEGMLSLSSSNDGKGAFDGNIGCESEIEDSNAFDFFYLYVENLMKYLKAIQYDTISISGIWNDGMGDGHYYCDLEFSGNEIKDGAVLLARSTDFDYSQEEWNVDRQK